jgi:hypothetical protein
MVTQVSLCPLLGHSRRNEDKVSERLVAVITTAFEDTSNALGLVDRQDPAVTMVAKRMFELARGGETDPILLRDAVLKSFKNDPGTAVV